MSRAYLAFTAKGEALAHRLAEALPGSVSRCGGDVTLKGWTAEHFAQDEALIFVGAVGIAVRAIAPHCRSKAADPAVVVVDEGGSFAVPLLSGHLGGANALARALAKACGAVPVITTATDVNGLFAVDLWAKAQNCAVLEPERIKRVSGALLAGQTVRYWSPWPVAGETPAGVKKADAYRPAERKFARKNAKGKRRARKFDNNGRAENVAHKPRNAAVRAEIDRFTDYIPAFQIHFSADGENYSCAHCCNAEPARLNENDNYYLPRRCKRIIHVNGKKSRYANGACRGVKRVYITYAHTVAQAERHYQQDRAYQNKGRKPERDDARGRKMS